MMDRRDQGGSTVPQTSNRSTPQAEVTGAPRGNACQSENKKKARPQWPGFFVFRAPQLVG
jgi:hypothetical protein